MLFAEVDAGSVAFWVQAIRDFGALGILGLLVWQLQPLVKVLLEHQAKNSELDRVARHASNTTFQAAIAEAYSTMRAEGKDNRDAQAREFAMLRDQIKGACLFQQHQHATAKG